MITDLQHINAQPADTSIRLRKIEPTDVPFLYQWENDASAWADGANHNPLSQNDLREYIATTTGDIYRDGQLRLIIELQSQSNGDLPSNSYATVGCIDLFNFDIRNRRAEIGMYIAPEYRGKGVGRQAVMAVEQYAFKELNLRLIYAIISTANNACTSLYASLNYEPSSILKQWTLESNAILWQKNA